MEGENPMHRSLITPGREDLSPWPPIGQLPFETITAMNEEQLNRAFKERHGLDNIFKPGKPDYKSFNYYRSDADTGARRLELKQIVLARLEGIGLGPDSEIWDWHDSVKPETVNLVGSLRVILKNFLSDECKGRIEEVWKKVAREAGVLQPNPECLKLEKQIQTRLRAAGQPSLSIKDIFKQDRLPSHPGTGLLGNVLNLEMGLRLFLFKLEGWSNAESAEKLRMNKESMQTSWMIYFTPRAREICRAAAGRKPRYDRNR